MVWDKPSLLRVGVLPNKRKDVAVNRKSDEAIGRGFVMAS
jgi:hypothetical protein